MEDFDPQPYIEQLTELAIAYAPQSSVGISYTCHMKTVLIKPEK